jgi:hypothetical protein
MGGAAPQTGTIEGAYNRIGSYAPTYDADDDVLTVRPSVRFNVSDDGKTWVEVGDAIYFENVFTDSVQSLTNVFYVDFKWSF